MDRIHYAGDAILTGTEIARALLDYAQALAQAGTSATVDIPTVNADGSPGRSEVLVGPASQLISDSEESPHPDPVDEDLVARLGAESRRLRSYGLARPEAVVPPGTTAPTRRRSDGDDVPEDWSEYGV
ncbi:hypothetical protein F6J84_12005 [Microbacterium caowuchunii]|uniref:hypothetical protein n=1 Tax=Microbacterium caowuchunii TaxID=2614638 RepID=UPI001248638A|nr:hypothetical protein [Microbacterium caowuchunii]QEW00752.1 hypothetical protein F6J84_12005 [Microbacterium caowuchunii]